MRICDNCMTPAESFGHIREVEIVESTAPTTEGLARNHALVEPQPVPDKLTTVTHKSELCTSCREMLAKADWAALSAAKRVSTVKRARTPRLADAFTPRADA